MKKSTRRNSYFSNDSRCKYKVLKLSTGVVSALVGISFISQQAIVNAEEVQPVMNVEGSDQLLTNEDPTTPSNEAIEPPVALLSEPKEETLDTNQSDDTPFSNELDHRALKEVETLNGTVELAHSFESETVWENDAIEEAMASSEYTEINYDVYPTVQSSEYGEGVVRLDQGLNLVVGNHVDLYTRNRLKDTLQNYGLSYETSENTVADKLNVYIGVYGDQSQAEAHQATNQLSEDLFDKIDAYRLVVKNDGVSVVGKDTDSVFFGLTTFKHMLNNKELPVLREVVVEDYADMKNRGFIEGYYGNPWSNEDRAELMRYGSELKMTQYFFAPKDDPYHNSKWRELYPEEELSEIRELARVGNETKTRYVWTLHPFMNDRIDFTNDTTYQRDLQVVKDKFTQLMDVGVREFGILADDASLPVGGYESYNKLMHDLTVWLEEKQETYQGLRKEMIFVPQEYWGDGDEPELLSLNKNLPESSPLTLTGGRIWGEVSTEFLTRLKANLTANGDGYRPVHLWINWPCTDNSKEHLILGGGDTFLHPNVDPSLIHGIMLNPMQQSEPSKIALFSAAEYTWKVWDSVEHANKINDIAFNFAENGTFESSDTAAAFRELGKHMINQDMDGRVRVLQESVELAPKLNAFLTKFQAGEDASIEREVLRGEFKQLKEAAELYKASGNERMRDQIIYWLDNTIDQMEALDALLTATEYSGTDNQAKLWEYFNQGHTKYEESKTHIFKYVNEYKNAELGVQHIKPFVLTLIETLANEIDLNMNPDAIIMTYISNRPDKAASNAAIFDKDPATEHIYKTPNSIQTGEYVGVEFNRVIDLNSFLFAMGANANPLDTFTTADIEYLSEDGQWEKLNNHNYIGNENEIYLNDLSLKAKGIRLIATSDRLNTWLGVRDILVNETYVNLSDEVLRPTVQAGGGIVFTWGTSAAQMTDGNLETESMFKNENGQDNLPAGGWVQLSLEEAKLITALKLVQGSGDKLERGIIEYSIDGENWTELQQLSGQQTVELTKPFEAKYVRVKNNVEMNKWLRIKEFSLESAATTKKYTESNNEQLAETLVKKDQNSYHLLIANDTVLRANEYVGIKLDQIYRLNEVNNMIENDQLAVYYSPNNIEWYKASELTNSDINYARYVRVVNLSSQDQLVSGNGFELNVEVYGQPELEDTNFGISRFYGENDARRLNNIADLFDGVYNKHVEFTDVASEGSFFTVKLGHAREIHKLRAYIQDGTGNYLRDGKIQISEDGETWVDIIEVGDGVENVEHRDQSITDGYTHDSNKPGNRYIEGSLDSAVKTNYIRVIATAPYRHRFVSFTEFVINDGEFSKDYIDETVVTTAPETHHLDTANLTDGKVLTQFGPQADSGEVTYRLSQQTNANHIRLISSIPDGVSVKVFAKVTKAGENNYENMIETQEIELGTVDNSFETFVLNEEFANLLEVRLVWDGGRPIFNALSTFWQEIEQPVIVKEPKWTQSEDGRSWTYTNERGEVVETLNRDGLRRGESQQYDTIVKIGDDEYYVKPEKYAGKLTINQWAYSPSADAWYLTDATGKIIEKADATGYYINGVQQFDVVKTIGNGKGFQVYYKPENYGGKVTRNQWAYSPSEKTWYKTDRSGKIIEVASREGYYVNGVQKMDIVVRVGNGKGQEVYYQADGRLLVNGQATSPKTNVAYRANQSGVITRV